MVFKFDSIAAGRPVRPQFNIKTPRAFSLVRKYSFFFTLLVAIGGLYEPKLGLLVIPVIIGLLLFSFFKGRYWCGNVCAHGSLFDSLLLPFSRNGKIPNFFKWKTVSILFFSWFAYRLTSRFIMIAGLYGTYTFWDKIGFVFVNSYIMVTVLGGVLGLFLSPRTWCNFCPMGFMQKASYFAGRKINVTKITDEKVSISDKSQCHKCAKCARVCPMQLVPYENFSDTNQFDNVNCLKCSTCVVNCPADVLTITTEKTSEFMMKNIKKEAGKNRKRFETTLMKVTDLKPDVKEFIFQLKDSSIKFISGQFILVKIKDNPEMFRAFSVSFFDEAESRIGVTVKQVPGGYGTDILFRDFKEGKDVVLEGPIGDELVIDDKTEKVLLVGGGIGITPFLPMVIDAVKNKNLQEIKLIYGVNKEEELLYNEEFERLERENSNFEFIKVAAFDENWQGEKGFVTGPMERLDLDEYNIYMCGPPPMINAALSKLDKLGIGKEKIYYESA